MKQSDLISKKWIVEIPDSEMGLILVNDKEGLTIHDGFDLEIAKAVSAIPEMIHALTEALDYFGHQEVAKGEDVSDEIRVIYDALKKAGCFDES